jgi:phosphopantothenoylcysteine decarboxylase/phosphopantothenate--cysteine ligase
VTKQKAHILLIITGSIAAVKSLDVIRELKAKKHNVTVVLTKGGEQFVTPMACAALSGNKVYQNIFSLADETEMGHIALSRNADVIAVIPATADFMAKMAHGLCDDLASTLYIASDKPTIIAPAMNVKMWEHAATKRNAKTLKKDGVTFIGPKSGSLACGEKGEGRMSEPYEIVAAIEKQLDGNSATKITGPLAGLKALVTSGPTREKIDPVRYITNNSSGKQGHAIASALAMLGAEVTLVSGPTERKNPEGVKVIDVESAQQMFDACESALPMDIAVCTAAVADWRAACVSDQKIKKNKSKTVTKGDDMTFKFEENPDILVSLSKHPRKRPKLVIGFAAESEHVVENARVKLEQKGCDWIVANDVMGGDVFDSDENTVHIISKKSQEDWPKLSKEHVAHRLAAKIAGHFEKIKH